jgi:lysyl endopeptidase
MKNLFPLLLLLITVSSSYAQLSQGGKPTSLKKYSQLSTDVPFERMPEVDLETLLAEDEINYPNKVGPYRFGEKHFVSMSMENSGTWETLNNGDRVWRLGVVSSDAYTLNFIFNNFFIPEGGKLHIYNEETGHILGAFTNENNRQDGWFGTFLLTGDQAVIEYHEPRIALGLGHFNLAEIVHGYRDVLNLNADASRGGGSGSCNIDVECSLGNGWEDQINSVGILLSNGNSFCTGAMVTDVPDSGTPYFLTANHCVGGSVANWSVGFNYQASSCNGSTNFLPSYQSLSGATLRASNTGSDFALLEWDNVPPANYGVFYAGWSNLNQSSTESTCIHHPSGDLKKISRDNGTVSNSTYSGATTWQVGAWEQGTTEPGSSGSPLFDQNKRITGQLYGGGASCFNIGASDYYGKFSTSWDGNNSASRLRDWLDPANSGTTTVDGYDPNTPTISYDAQLISIDNPTAGSAICESSIAPTLTIKNNGGVTLTSVTVGYTINGNPSSTTWTGSLATGSSASFTLPAIALNAGTNTLTVTLSNPNNQSDGDNGNNAASVTFSSVSGDTFVTLVLNTDDYGSETTWTLSENGGGTIASGGPYADANLQIEEELCVQSGECYTFTIFDSFDDGICCYTGTQNPNYQDGNYSLGDADDILIYTGSEFGSSEATNFCVPASVSDCDALFDPFEANASAYRLYPSDNGGYIAGSNSFGDLTKAQEFSAPSQPSEITGFIAWIAAKTDDGGVDVVANLYAMDGAGTAANGATNSAPGTILASGTAPLARVDTSGFFTQFNFNTPVSVSSNYAVGLNFTNFGNNDVIGIVTNTDGDAGGNELAWEAWASGDWYTMNAAWNTASDGDFDLALFPIVCPQNVTGIEDLSDYFTLFPNPNNGQFAVVNSALFNGNLEIYNTMGQSVFSAALFGQPAINCDIASRKAGIYLIQITSDNGTWTSRVVKN